MNAKSSKYAKIAVITQLLLLFSYIPSIFAEDPVQDTKLRSVITLEQNALLVSYSERLEFHPVDFTNYHDLKEVMGSEDWGHISNSGPNITSQNDLLKFTKSLCKNNFSTRIINPRRINLTYLIMKKEDDTFIGWCMLQTVSINGLDGINYAVFIKKDECKKGYAREGFEHFLRSKIFNQNVHFFWLAHIENHNSVRAVKKMAEQNIVRFHSQEDDFLVFVGYQSVFFL